MMKRPRTLHALLLAALILSALQLLTAFTHHAFAYGLLGVDVPPELAATALPFLAPLILLAFPHGGGRGLLIGAALVMQLSRVALPLVHGGVAVIVSAVGLAAFLVLLPAYLFSLSGTRGHQLLGPGAALGMLAFVTLRSLGHGIEPSTRGAGMIIGVGLALLIVVLMWQAPRPADEADEAGSNIGFGRALIYAIGVWGALSLAYFTFSAPNVVARWTAARLTWVFVVVALAGAAGTAMLTFAGVFSRRARKWRIVVGASALAALLLAAAIMNRVPFGGAYPVDAPEPATALIFPALLFWPFAAAAFGELGAALVRGRPSMRALAGAFSIASVLTLLFVAVQLLNTLYAYVPLVGPPLRNLYWLGVLLPAVAMLAPLFAVDAGSAIDGPERYPIVGLALLLALMATGAALLPGPEPAAAGSSLRIVTFNMQQGFSKAGHENLRAQRDVLRDLNADVIGLQESDTNRVAGGNEDAVGYFARELGMYSVYGPSNIAGTFGVALLSRHPISDSITKYIDSGDGEQVAVLIATLDAVPPLRVAVTHLGNCGPAREMDQILDIVASEQATLLMGDFNFTASGSDPSDTSCSAPNDAYQRVLDAGFSDAWRLVFPSDEDGPTTHIDHIFNQGSKPLAARYVEVAVSDHQPYLIDVQK